MFTCALCNQCLVGRKTVIIDCCSEILCLSCFSKNRTFSKENQQIILRTPEICCFCSKIVTRALRCPSIEAWSQNYLVGVQKNLPLSFMCNGNDYKNLFCFIEKNVILFEKVLKAAETPKNIKDGSLEFFVEKYFRDCLATCHLVYNNQKKFLDFFKSLTTVPPIELREYRALPLLASIYQSLSDFKLPFKPRKGLAKLDFNKLLIIMNDYELENLVELSPFEFILLVGATETENKNIGSLVFTFLTLSPCWSQIKFGGFTFRVNSSALIELEILSLTDDSYITKLDSLEFLESKLNTCLTHLESEPSIFLESNFITSKHEFQTQSKSNTFKFAKKSKSSNASSSTTATTKTGESATRSTEASTSIEDDDDAEDDEEDDDEEEDDDDEGTLLELSFGNEEQQNRLYAWEMVSNDHFSLSPITYYKFINQKIHFFVYIHKNNFKDFEKTVVLRELTTENVQKQLDSIQKILKMFELYFLQ